MKKTKISVAVLAALSFSAGAFGAQEATDAAEESVKAKTEKAKKDEMVVEEIKVTGMRASELQAINMKRFSDVVSDALSAEEIGVLPDQSIAESLERLAGVSGNQDKGRSNTIYVRGMGGGYTLTTLNGREVVGSFGSRSVNLSLYPSESIRRAQVYKTANAEMLEGGIGGTVNMETFRPLEADGVVRSASISLNGNDLNSDLVDADKLGNRISGMFSHKFGDTFAVSLGASLRNDTRYIEGVKAGSLLHGLGWTTDFNGDGQATEYSPPSSVLTSKLFDIEQNSVFASAQWQATDKLLVSADHLEADYGYEMDMAVLSFWGLSSGAPMIDPAMADINARGYVMSGLASVGSIGKWDANVLNDDATTASGINFDFELNDDMKVELDLSRSTADRMYQWRSGNGTFAAGMQHYLSWDMNDGTFGLNYLGSSPDGSAYDASTYTLDQSALTSVINDPSLWAFSGVNWGRGQVFSELDAVKLDFTWAVDFGLFTELKAGVRQSSMNKEIVEDDEYYSAAILDAPDFDALNTSLTSKPYQKLNVTGFDEYFYFNPGQILADNMANLPERAQSNADLLESYVLNEDTSSAYFQARFDGDWFDGVLGLRYYSTELEASSYTSDFYFATTNGNLFMEVADDLAYTTVTNDYSDVLPSLNINFRPNDISIIRVGLGQAMIRPSTTEIGPNVKVSRKRIWDSNAVLSERTLGQKGNPMLPAITSTQADVSFEWYPTKWDYYSFAMFYKDLDGLYEQGAEYIPIDGEFTAAGDQLYLPLSTEVVGEGGEVTGIEIGFRQDLGKFCGCLKGLALSGNYMDFDHQAQQDYNPRYAGQNPASRPTELYYAPVGWINSTSNLTLTYDLGKKLSARINLNQQDYMAVKDGNDYGIRWPNKNLSVSANYKITKDITLFAQAANLLDEETTTGNLKSDKVGIPHPDYIFEQNHRGVSWYAGVRARF